MAAVSAPYEIPDADASAQLEDSFAGTGANDNFVDLAARVVLPLMIYVGSIGPMYWTWYAAKYLNGSWFVAALYEPLWRLAAIPPIGHWLNWYISLWIY